MPEKFMKTKGFKSLFFATKKMGSSDLRKLKL